MFRILLFFLLPACGWSATVSLRLDQIATRVRQQHPQLQAARLLVDEARARQQGVGLLSNPTASVEYAIESALSPGAVTVAFDQSFPLTARLRLEKALSAQGVDAADLEVRETEGQFIAAAKTLAIQWIALTRQEALLKRQSDLIQELADFVADRAKAGELSPLEAMQARTEASHFSLDRRRLQTQRIAVAGQLKPMLGIPPDTTLQLTGTLDTVALPDNASGTHRPDLQRSQLQEAAAQTSTALARANRFEDVSVGLFASTEYQNRVDSGPTRGGIAGFRLSLPLPLWNRNEAAIAESLLRAGRAHQESAALATTIRHEIQTARDEMKAHAACLRETRDTLLPAVIEQTEALQKAYQSGQTALIDVLRSREQQLGLEAAALDAARDFQLARVRYQAATGIFD